MEAPARQVIVRFGVFDVDAASRELRRQGIRVRLPGQPFEILLMLLERPGEVIPREDMRRRLWPDDTFVDFEHGLNSAVKKLRAALGDSAEHPRYIETLPRVGYRFIAPVHAPPIMPAGASEPAPRGVWRRIAPAVVFAVLVTAISASLIHRPTAQVLDATRLTTTSRVDRFGRIQTDGSRIFFLERHGHRWDLMQMPASGGPVERFDLPFPNARIFGLSPDRSTMLVGSFTSRDGLMPLWIVPSVGGTPRRVGEIVVRDAIFTPDGRRITYSTQDGIYTTNPDGSRAERLASLSGHIEALAWAPDGRALRFEWGNLVYETYAIWEVDAKGGHLHAVLAGWDKTPQQCCGRWTADGQYYLFTSRNHGGATNVWALPEARRFGSLPFLSWLPGHEPILVTAGPVRMDQPLPSPNGERLFTLGSNERTEYVRFDPATRQSSSLLRGSSAAWLAATPDQQTVIYWDDGALWRSRPDGSGRTEIVAAAYHPKYPQLSRDGRQIAFQGSEQDSDMPRTYRVAVDGGAVRAIVPGSQASRLPAWSPDAASILYAVDAGDPGGAAPGLYIFDLNSQSSTRLPGSEPYRKTSWSPDGQSIAAGTPDDTLLMLFDRRSQQWTQLAKGDVIGPALWSADSQFIYFQDVVEENEPIRRVNVSTRRVDQIAEFRALLEGGVQRCGFEGLASDGTFVLRLSRGDHDVYSLKLALR